MSDYVAFAVILLASLAAGCPLLTRHGFLNGDHWKGKP